MDLITKLSGLLKAITYTIRVIASVILKLSECEKVKSHGLQDFLFASSFKRFGVAAASAAFKCACKRLLILYEVAFSFPFTLSPQ
jgi:hypothetical protein